MPIRVEPEPRDDGVVVLGQLAAEVDRHARGHVAPRVACFPEGALEPLVADLLEVGEVDRVVDVAVRVLVAPADLDLLLVHVASRVERMVRACDGRSQPSPFSPLPQLRRRRRRIAAPRACCREGHALAATPAWGVHPTREDVLGLPCFPSVAALPETPELAALLVGHERVEQAFEDALAGGVRAFFLPGLGNEAGPAGPEIAARIAARARAEDVVLIGPNCMGVAAPEELSLWIGTVPDTFKPGRVSVISQSGSIAEALLGIGPRVGFRCIVSSGGEAVSDAADFLGFLAEDDGTGAVGLFLETVRRPADFASALERCAEAGKPVVCLKVGRSQAGGRAALAHTGAVVGSNRAFSALLRRHGAVGVEDFTALVETLEVLGRSRRPRGKRIAAISESGGEGALLADQGEAAGMPFEPLPTEVAVELTSRFPNYLAPGNPLDAWAIDEAEVVFPGSLEILAGSGAYDILVAQADQSQFRGEEEHEWCFMIVKALAEIDRRHGDLPRGDDGVRGRPPARGGRVRTRARRRAPARPARRHARARGRRRPASRTRAGSAAAAVGLDDLLAEGALAEFESALVLERYGVPVRRGGVRRPRTRRRRRLPSSASRSS